MITNITKYSYLVGIILWSSLATLAQTSPYFVNTFTTEVTGASKTNLWLAPTPKGEMAFANIRGLLTYNGKKWTLNTYQFRNVDLEIYHLLYHQNKVFVGAKNELGVLEKKEGRYQYRSFKVGKYHQEKINTTIRQIIEYQGHVFFVSADKLFIVTQGKISQVIKTTKGTLFVNLFKVKNQLYLSKYREGLLVWKNKRFVLQSNASLYKKRFISFMCETPKGTLVFTFRQGIWLDRQGQFTRLSFPANVEKVLKERIIQPRFYDDQRILFGTAKGKIYLLHLQTHQLQEVFATRHHLRAMYTDALKNVWIIDSNNIYYLELSSPFTRYFPPQEIGKMVATPAGVFSFAYNRSQVFWKKIAGDTAQFDLKAPVRSIAFLPPDKLLVGTRKGIYALNYQSGQTQKISSLANIRLIQLDSISQKIVYLATHNTLSVAKFNANYTLELLGQLEGIEEGILSVARTGKQLWLSHFSAGITRLTLDFDVLPNILHKKLYQGQKDGFQTNDTEFFIHQHQGKIWVNNPSGIYSYNAVTDRFERLRVHRRDTSRFFYPTFVAFEGNKIFASGQSNVFSEMGIVRKKNNSSYTLHTLPFKRLPKYEISQVLYHQNQWYLATSKGLLQYNPQKVKDYQTAFQTLLSKAQHLETPLKNQCILPYDQNQVNFEFTANYYEAPEKTQFAYQLAGFDDTWSAWSKTHKKEYTNLPEGKYIFKVKSKNVYGTEGKVTTFSFKVLPPWYRTYGAYALYMFCFLLGIYGAIRGYTYRIRLRNRQLEVQVKKRTLELNEANEELTTANEQLKELGDLKESFSQMLIHDARQPLTPIVTSTDPVIKNAGQHLMAYFDNFLEVQKFEATEVQLDLQVQTLSKTVAEAIHQVRFSASQKLITIQHRIPADLLVEADAAYLLRVFTNFLGNAIKYIPSSSTIRLTCEVLPDAQFVKIWILDNGPGVPDILKTSIFDKFTRANKGDKRSTGLGLTFCKMVVEAHGGNIGVLTQSDQQAKDTSGAAFWFTVPQASKSISNNTPSKLASSANVQYNFTETDRLLVKKLLPQLAQLEFCDSSDIEAVFDDRDWTGSEALEAWIYALPFLQSQQEYLQKLDDIT